MRINNQSTIAMNNYQKNTVRKHNTTPNFKASVKTKIIGDINIPDEFKTNESITKYLNDNFGKVFSKEKIAQILAEVLTALGVAKVVNNSDNTITEEEKQKLDEYLKKYDFDPQDINKMQEIKNMAYTPLIYACMYEKTDIVKILLKCPDINVNIQDNDGDTALISAASRGNTEIVKALLNHPNIDVNMQDKYGETALILAVDKGNVEGLKALLENPNIDVNIQNKEGFTALIWAASRGNTEIVKALLNHPNIDVNMQDKYGFTTLISAASRGNTEIVKALSENPNIDVNIQNNFGSTALILAAQFKRTETVKALLEINNIDINILNNLGISAINYMPEITQMKKEIDERKAKVTIEAQEKFEAFGFTDKDYFDLSTYEIVLNSDMSKKAKEKIFNEKQNSNEDSLLSYLAGYPIIKDKDSATRLEKILEKMEKLNINYNQKDRYGISALENIMNSSNIVFLRHYINKKAKTDYYPGLDVAYKSIQSEEFKKLLDEHIYRVVNFKDVKEAMESQSAEAMTAVNYQMHSPFFDMSHQV